MYKQTKIIINYSQINKEVEIKYFDTVHILNN